jgi:pimeloyl-ACP methyl ester carboxylesterase
MIGLAGLTLLMGSAVSTSDLARDFVRSKVQVPDGEISYLVRRRAGPMLVLIPGSFVDARDWEATIRHLDPRFALMIVELRGHGQSWPPPVRGRGSIEQFAEDVLRATDHAGVQRFYVGGHSIGGMVAIEIAGRRGDRLKGIIAVEGWTHHSVAQDAFQGANHANLSPAQQARLVELRGAVMTRWTREQVADFGGIWRRWNGYEILSRTSVPILEIWGDRNRPHPSLARMKIPQRPNIEVCWIAGASHYLPLERPEELAGAMNTFIQRLESGGRRGE